MSTTQRQKQFDRNRSRATNTASGSSSSSNNSNAAVSTKNVVSPNQRKLQTSMERLQVQQANTSRRAAGSNWMAAAGGEIYFFRMTVLRCLWKTESSSPHIDSFSLEFLIINYTKKNNDGGTYFVYNYYVFLIIC